MKKLSVLLLLLTMTTSNVHAACSSNLPCEVGSDNSGMSNAESAALVVGSALALGALFGYISDHYYNHKKHEKHVDLSKKYTIRIEKYAQK